jgi:alpha-beta hydrolase superfamily lysophospholipase
LLLLTGCVAELAPPGPPIGAPEMTAEAFVMADGVALPYRAWPTEAEPRAVVLALHGINDSRDAWELPAPILAAAGIAVYAPDQRGFGETSSRGYWPTTEGLIADTRAALALLRTRHPGVPVVLMGESMGGAVAIVTATRAGPAAADALVLISPAVWGRARMNMLTRAVLWLASNTVPGLVLQPEGIPRVTASDNIEALRALGRNPKTIRATRVDVVRGLVDLMDAALAAAPALPARTLILYGGRNELIPPAAMRALWGALPNGAVTAFYPEGYHLLLRDLGRMAPIQDIVGWITEPGAPPPSAAAARDWLAR